MKQLLFLILGLTLSSSVPTRAQLMALNARHVSQSTKERNVLSLKDALSELEKQYHVSFIYSTDKINTKVIFVSRRRWSVEDALTNLLHDTDLKFAKIQNNFYVITSKDADKNSSQKVNTIEPKGLEKQSSEELSTGIANIARLESTGYTLLASERPQADIGGKVSDTNGQGIPGVSVVVKGTSRGTTTNADGNFTLNADASATLVFSFVGYLTQEIVLSGRNQLTVTLQPDERALEEVVVVGYGTQKRASVTGAVSSVTPKELTALPVISAESALQGRVPGVRVVNNGSPGQAPIVRIRGIGSINFASGPLYVIDGIPSGDLNNLDPKDIESLEVLKDASSAAIYGSRASNGVVIITTKRGSKDGQLHVSFDSYVGSQSAWKRLDLLNTQQYVQYATALNGNAGIALPGRLSNLNTPIYDGASQTFAQTNTDWQDVMFRTAPVQQHQVSVSGGNQKSRFFASAGYFDQEGILIGTNYKRGNVRLNSDHQITKAISFGQTLMISYDKTRGEQGFGGGRTAVMQTIRNLPYWPVTDPTKVGGYSSPTAADGSDPDNPVRIALMDQSYSQRVKLLGTLYTEIKFTNFLKYRFSFGADIVSWRNNDIYPIYNDGYKSRPQMQLNDTRGMYFSPILTNQLTFDKTFGKHYLNATVVAEQQTFRSSSLTSTGYRPNNDIQVMQGISNPGTSSSLDESSLISYVARVNYDFGGKYLLSASVRRDGSSRFAPGNKWGTFPSASVGWRLSEESFLKSVPSISELKLRASYGETGFNGIGSYAWQSLVQADNTNYIFGSTRNLGSYFSALGNTELKWETTKMTNVGVDLGLFSNKITFTAEVYNRLTDGLLLNVPIPNSIGYSSAPLANIGSMKNWGYEFQATYSQNQGSFHWNLSGNIDITRNRILSLATPSATIYSGLNQDFGGFDITKTEAGHPIQSFYGWQVDGIFQSVDEVYNAPRQNRPDTRDAHDPTKNTSAGDIRFKDINGDGVINANDRTYLGSFIPKFSYGVNFGSNYKNFDLTLYMQGVQGNKIYNGTKVIEQGMLRLFNSGTDVLNAWTSSNTNTNVPRAVNGDPNNNSRTSDRFIEDGSYMRLKNLTLGYTVPAEVLTRISKNTLNKLRVYVSATNLLTFTKYTGLDPEIGVNGSSGDTSKLLVNGIDYGQYPQPRTLQIGLNFGFLSPSGLDINREEDEKKFLITAILFLGLISGCKEEVLDKTNPNGVTVDNFYKNGVELTSAVTAIYASAKSNFLTSREWFFLHDLRSDDVASGGGQLETPRNQLLLGSHDPGNAVMGNVWAGYYRLIHRANSVLDLSTKVSDLPDATKNRLLAEARFLRAWAYFDLVTMWGGVPLYKSYVTSVDGSLPRSAEKDVYDFIIADLKTAQEALPATYVAADFGRVTKGAAQMLLAKIYLQQADYANAKTELQKIISSGTYSLVDEFGDNFLEETEFNKESIWEINFYPSNGAYNWDGDGNGATAGTETVRTQEYSAIGWRNIIPSNTLLNEFEKTAKGDTKTDPRFAKSFYFTGDKYNSDKNTLTDEAQNGNSSVVGGVTMKISWRKFSLMYKTDQSFMTGGINQRIMRYAETLLAMAECENELGNSTSAVTYLNQVRARKSVTMPAYPTANYPVTTKDQVFAAIVHERRVELGGEQIRNRDILRWRKAGKLTVEPFSYFQKNKHELLPIPQTEVDNNPKLNLPTKTQAINNWIAYLFTRAEGEGSSL